MASGFLLWRYEKRGGDEKGVLTDKVFWGPKRVNAKMLWLRQCEKMPKCCGAPVQISRGGWAADQKNSRLKRHKPSVYNYYVIVTAQG